MSGSLQRDELSPRISLLFQGYYVRNNMLGPDGDFITSPEISQIFGEVNSFRAVGGVTSAVSVVAQTAPTETKTLFLLGSS